jgi:hypothetical protein
MTDERRYEDDEVAEIFRLAASSRAADAPAPAHEGGLSLAELQAIGGEVGIAPERIAGAAAALELRRGATPRRTHLGLPVSVGRTVDLPRAPTDREWELLVTELRATFGAHGRDRSQGGLRAWANGNLHAYVEPTESGYRLRLGTLKSNAVVLGRLGMAGMAGAAVMLAMYFLASGLAKDVRAAVVFGVMGIAALVANAVRLPGWAREREEQMEHIAERARALVRAEPEPAASVDG